MPPERASTERRVPAGFLLRSLVGREGPHEREGLLVRCACARRFAHTLRPEQLAFVERAEAVADGRATVRRPEPPDPDATTELLKGLAHPQPAGFDYFAGLLALVGPRPSAQDHLAQLTGLVGSGEGARAAEEAVQSEIVRDVFGDRERVGAFAPEWRTSDVLALAWHTYDTGDFSVLPILADALQDAGCDDADILEHCRAEGPHVRGCWAVDEVLELRSGPARLRSLVHLDHLTGVGNRLAFQLVLSEAVRRAVRTPLSLLHVDIDHFCSVNRTFSQLAGDRTLRGFAQLAGEVVGEAGLLARTTGDGFHVVLPATDAGAARELAELLRAEVAAWAGVESPITISVGVATTRPGAGHAISLQRAAEAALAEAKRAGRNRVCG